MAVVFIRTVLLYFLIVVALRIMGRRQIGELQPSEFVITILISNIAALPIENPTTPLSSGVIPILTLVCLEVFSSMVLLKWIGLRKWITGSPKVLIKDGILDQKMMKQLRFNMSDLAEELRDKDVFDINEVDFAVVETTGKLSIYKKFPHRTVTADMLSLSPTQDESVRITAISDGHIHKEGLQLYGRDKEWLEEELRKRDLVIGDIFLLTMNRSGELSYILKGQ